MLMANKRRPALERSAAHRTRALGKQRTAIPPLGELELAPAPTPQTALELLF